MIKPVSEQKALERLKKLRSAYRQKVADGYEHRAKNCLTCETKGACCLDAHFVNVHISRLEAVAITNALETLPENIRQAGYKRIDAAIEKYDLTTDGDTFSKTFACPLFEKGIGCLVHKTGKPTPCISHACYENKADLPPDDLQTEQELLIDDLNRKTYGRWQAPLPLPLAITRVKEMSLAPAQTSGNNLSVPPA